MAPTPPAHHSVSPQTIQHTSPEQAITERMTSLVAEPQPGVGELDPIYQFVHGRPRVPSEPATRLPAAQRSLKRKQGHEIEIEIGTEIDRYGKPLQKPTPLGNDEWRCNNLIRYGDDYITCIPKGSNGTLGSWNAYTRHEREQHKKVKEGVNSWKCRKEGCLDEGKEFGRRVRLKKHCRKKHGAV